jgi:hypothetical protein
MVNIRQCDLQFPGTETDDQQHFVHRVALEWNRYIRAAGSNSSMEFIFQGFARSIASTSLLCHFRTSSGNAIMTSYIRWPRTDLAASPRQKMITVMTSQAETSPLVFSSGHFHIEGTFLGFVAPLQTEWPMLLPSSDWLF